MFINAQAALLLFFTTQALHSCQLCSNSNTFTVNFSKILWGLLWRYISRHTQWAVSTLGAGKPGFWPCLHEYVGNCFHYSAPCFIHPESGFNHSYLFSKASNPHAPCTVSCGWSKSLMWAGQQLRAQTACVHTLPRNSLHCGALVSHARPLCLLFYLQNEDPVPQRMW